MKKTFEQLVEANKFGYKYINPSYQPQKVSGKKVEIELQHFGKYTTNQEFLDWCKENGKRPATFNEALQFALDNPDEQKKYWLVTYDSEQLYYLILYADGGRRELDVSRSTPGHGWYESVRFLVVPAPAVSASLDSKPLGSSGSLDSLPFDPSKIILEYEGRRFKLSEFEEEN